MVYIFCIISIETNGRISHKVGGINDNFRLKQLDDVYDETVTLLIYLFGLSYRSLAIQEL